MSTEISTQIDGYEVELDLDHGEPLTDCLVVYRTRNVTYSASLACLQDTGFLYGSNASGDYEYAVPQHTIDRIEAWALENGY